MAKREINTVKKIVKLGKRELRWTCMEDELKFDIREWKSESKYEDGARFTIPEFRSLIRGEEMIGKKQLMLDGESWCLALKSNGRVYKRPFATKEELEKCKTVGMKFDKLDDSAFLKAMLSYEEKPVVATTVKKKEEKPKKVYTSGYERFSDMFEEYRKGQPENMQNGFKIFHDIVLEHIKEICESSEEYNAACLQDWKTSHKLMMYLRDKAFENPQVMMDFEKGKVAIYQYTDEYMGLDDKPQPKPEPEKKTPAKRGRKKKVAE